MSDLNDQELSDLIATKSNDALLEMWGWAWAAMTSEQDDKKRWRYYRDVTFIQHAIRKRMKDEN